MQVRAASHLLLGLLHESGLLAATLQHLRRYEVLIVQVIQQFLDLLPRAQILAMDVEKSGFDQVQFLISHLACNARMLTLQ